MGSFEDKTPERGMHYSNFRYGEGVWYRGPRSADVLDPELVITGALVQLYGPGDVLIASLSSDAADSRMSRLRFELTPTGPGYLDLDITSLPDGVGIQHAARVDVFLDGRLRPHGRIKPVYSGYIQQMPNAGSTEWPRKYRGFGFYGLLDKMMTTRTFMAASVWRIVDTLAREIETRTVGRIIYNSSKIQISHDGTGSAYPVEKIVFSKASYKTALTQLAGLAGGWEFGVDSDRELWFRAPITEPSNDSLLWCPQHVTQVTYNEDSTDVINRLWIKGGQRQTSGDNYLELPLDADGNESSQSLYGIREGDATAPSVFSDLDSYRWGACELAYRRKPRRTVSLGSLESRLNFIDCVGPLQVTLPDGSVILIPKSKVIYTVDQGIACDVQLGDLTYTPGQLSGELKAQQARAELLQQLTLTQV